uniref:GB1/RHD3-type G domain-containing protein n=1 Tax=Myotis myotis TaxID=51298 RepID=A0A7J7ZXH7_MYOMY|nr:hypothetical protein mMyoMyo1_009727 [Myotis myotis]
MMDPICLVENQNSQLTVNPTALEILDKISQPVVVVAIAGLYRTGKSYLMKCLAGQNHGFPLDSTVWSETKGIWMWCVPHPSKPSHTLVLLDTEGLGDVEKGDPKNDSWIFAPAMLLKSMFVYNSMSTINHQALEQLQYLAKACVDAINSGAVPCLETAVITLAERENSAAMQKAADHYSEQMAQRVSFPTDTLQELLDLHTACEKEAIVICMEHSFKDDKCEFQQKLMDIMEKMKENFLLKNEEESLKYCQAQLTQVSEPLMEGISKGTFSVSEAYILYSEEINKVEHSYDLVLKKGVKVRNKKIGEDQQLVLRVFVGTFEKSKMIGLPVYVK